jgi:hypothetical protein
MIPCLPPIKDCIKTNYGSQHREHGVHTYACGPVQAEKDKVHGENKRKNSVVNDSEVHKMSRFSKQQTAYFTRPV